MTLAMRQTALWRFGAVDFQRIERLNAYRLMSIRDLWMKAHGYV